MNNKKGNNNNNKGSQANQASTNYTQDITRKPPLQVYVLTQVSSPTLKVIYLPCNEGDDGISPIGIVIRQLEAKDSSHT